MLGGSGEGVHFQVNLGGRRRVAETARHHDVSRTLLARWGCQHRDGQLTRGGSHYRFRPLKRGGADTLSGSKKCRIHSLDLLRDSRW